MFALSVTAFNEAIAAALSNRSSRGKKTKDADECPAGRVVAQTMQPLCHRRPEWRPAPVRVVADAPFRATVDSPAPAWCMLNQTADALERALEGRRASLRAKSYLEAGNVPRFLETAMASTTGSRTTALRMRMIDAMVLRGFAERSQEAYVAAVRLLAEHLHSSPAVLSDDQVQGYLAGTCCRRATCRARR